MELHPLSELPHPLIAKARESFPHAGAEDNFVGQVRGSTHLRLLEIKAAQWRGGVWRDESTGVHWLVVAGLAKGGHRDWDDFYGRVARENEADTTRHWLPSDEDRKLLKQETAARLMTEWKLMVQQQLRDALVLVQGGGVTRLELPHPVPASEPGVMASVMIHIKPFRETDYKADEIVVEIAVARDFEGRKLAWDLTNHILAVLSPPDQDWDVLKTTYSNIQEPGYFGMRLSELNVLVARNELAQSEPGRMAHVAHRKHLAGSTIDGHAVRGLCGVFFVPTQDHDNLPVCKECELRLQEVAGRKAKTADLL